MTADKVNEQREEETNLGLKEWIEIWRFWTFLPQKFGSNVELAAICDVQMYYVFV